VLPSEYCEEQGKENEEELIEECFFLSQIHKIHHKEAKFNML